jgi:hypothetical protein
MYQPSAVWLSTVYGEERWLTDQFVLYNVTGFHELYYYDPSYGPEWQFADGPYQLSVSKGFKERDSVPEPDLDSWFERVYSVSDWVRAEPTEWSVAEDPGKPRPSRAMLWTSDGLPCLLGESTWVALKRNHPDCTVEYAHGELNVFRFSEVRHEGCDEDTYCGHRPVPFCFAAGIRCPEGQEDIAYGIARASMNIPVDPEVIDGEIVEEEAA